MGSLALTRKSGERIRITASNGEAIWITQGRIGGGRATSFFSAPRSVEIVREEVLTNGTRIECVGAKVSKAKKGRQ